MYFSKDGVLEQKEQQKLFQQNFVKLLEIDPKKSVENVFRGVEKLQKRRDQVSKFKALILQEKDV